MAVLTLFPISMILRSSTTWSTILPKPPEGFVDVIVDRSTIYNPSGADDRGITIRLTDYQNASGYDVTRQMHFVKTYLAAGKFRAGAMLDPSGMVVTPGRFIEALLDDDVSDPSKFIQVDLMIARKPITTGTMPGLIG